MLTHPICIFFSKFQNCLVKPFTSLYKIKTVRELVFDIVIYQCGLVFNSLKNNIEFASEASLKSLKIAIFDLMNGSS